MPNDRRTLKLSFQNGLGKALKSARKARQMTQLKLAKKTGLSAPTIRLLEHCRGTLDSWNKVLSALGLVVRGRNLPAEKGLRRQIIGARKRQGIGQRTLAKMTGVTQPTIVALERNGRGRLETLNRVLTVLGAGAALMPENSKLTFFASTGNSSAHHGWETPAWLLEVLHGVFGGFDLDPCSPTHNRRSAPVRARVHYTMEDDGLTLPWHGKVFVNPPYGRQLRDWTAKAKNEVVVENARVVVALIPARTDTTWWHEDVAGSATVFFLRGRLSFGDCGQAAPFPSAIVVWGGKTSELSRLRSALPKAWQPSAPGIETSLPLKPLSA